MATTEQLTAEELEEIAAKAPNGEEPAPFECPTCGRTFPSMASLNGHLASHRGAGNSAKAASSARSSRERPGSSPAGKVKVGAGLDAAARTIVNKAVANTQTVGALLAALPFTAHTGLTIAGLVDPDTKRVIVRSRAAVAGDILLGRLASATSADELQRAAQILELLRRYNSIFEYSALGDVVGSIGVAAAVDARLIGPDFRVKMGPVELPLVEATIGDVIAELDRQGLYEPAPGAPEHPDEQPMPPREPGAEVIPGDVTET